MPALATHAIIANYGGDANFAGSESQELSEVVKLGRQHRPSARGVKGWRGMRATHV